MRQALWRWVQARAWDAPGPAGAGRLVGTVLRLRATRTSSGGHRPSAFRRHLRVIPAEDGRGLPCPDAVGRTDTRQPVSARSDPGLAPGPSCCRPIRARTDGARPCQVVTRIFERCALPQTVRPSDVGLPYLVVRRHGWLLFFGADDSVAELLTD